MNKYIVDDQLDLVTLIKDIFDARSAGYHLSIDKRDALLAGAIADGRDSEILLLLKSHAAQLDEDADAAHAKLFVAEATLYEHMENMRSSAVYSIAAETLNRICDSYAEVIDVIKQHPEVSGKSNAELLIILRDEELRREQQPAEADTATTAS